MVYQCEGFVASPLGVRSAFAQALLDQGFDSSALRIELQGGVEMRVVGPALATSLGIRQRCDHADFRIVGAAVRVSIRDDLGRVVMASARACLRIRCSRAGLRGLWMRRNRRPLGLQRKAVVTVRQVAGRGGRHGLQRPAYGPAAPLAFQELAVGDQVPLHLPVVVFSEARTFRLQARFGLASE